MTEVSPETRRLIDELGLLDMNTKWPDAEARVIENALKESYRHGYRDGESHEIARNSFHRSKELQDLM